MFLWVFATILFLVFPSQTIRLLVSLGFENRYTFALPDHNSENLSAPPNIEINIGEKVLAVKVDRIFFMPYIAPHLDSQNSNIVAIIASEDAKETFLLGMKAGQANVSYNLYNLQGSGTKTNQGFTVTVKEP